MSAATVLLLAREITRLDDAVEQMLTILATVRTIHSPVNTENRPYCRTCLKIEWPCPTVTALDEAGQR